VSDETNPLVDLITEASAEYDRRVQERHDMGAEKYGQLAFLGKNTLEEAMQEVLDLGNYARYTFIRLYMMNAQLDEKYGEDAPPGGFQPNKPGLSPSLPNMFGGKS
jgi:hypothetical protein